MSHRTLQGLIRGARSQYGLPTRPHNRQDCLPCHRVLWGDYSRSPPTGARVRLNSSTELSPPTFRVPKTEQMKFEEPHGCSSWVREAFMASARAQNCPDSSPPRLREATPGETTLRSYPPHAPSQSSVSSKEETQLISRAVRTEYGIPRINWLSRWAYDRSYLTPDKRHICFIASRPSRSLHSTPPRLRHSSVTFPAQQVCEAERWRG